MRKKPLFLALLAGIALSGAAQATLIDRGGGLLYDDVLNITWLQDANYAKSSGYDADGRMTWEEAVTWAANLNYGGHSDWRVATMVDTVSRGCNPGNSGTDCGFNVQTFSDGAMYSEMAYMYYVNLGLKGYRNPDGSVRTDWGIYGNGTYNGSDFSSFGQVDIGLVENLQASWYWTGLQYENGNYVYEDGMYTSAFAWYFRPLDGNQYQSTKDSVYFVWAVRPGDVARPVPEADTWSLMLAGLGIVGALARRRMRAK